MKQDGLFDWIRRLWAWLEVCSQSRMLTILILLALVPRMFLALHYSSDVRYPDEKTYLNIAKNLVTHGRYITDWQDNTYTNQYCEANCPPLLPFAIAAVQILFGQQLLPVKIAMAFIGGVCVLPMWMLGRRMFGTAAATVACMWYAFYPMILYLNTLVYPQTVASLMLLLVVLGVASEQWRNSTAYVRAALTGVCLGCLILAIPVYAIAAILVGLWLLAEARQAACTWIRSLALVAVVTVFALCVVLPWTWRNKCVYGEPVLVCAGSAIVFYHPGNFQEFPFYLRDKLKPKSVIERERIIYHEAWVGIRQHFWVFVYRVTCKFGCLFGLWDTQSTITQYSSWKYKVVGAIFYLPVLVGVLAGFRRLLFAHRACRWILGIILVVAVFYAIYWVRIRYRLTFEPLLILLASGAWFGCARMEASGSDLEGPSGF